MNDLSRNHKPTAIRLKDLKAPLQKEAMKQDRSLNYLIFKILKEFVNNIKK
jgi:predicted HicB family RNase H-like nuclease